MTRPREHTTNTSSVERWYLCRTEPALGGEPLDKACAADEQALYVDYCRFYHQSKLGPPKSKQRADRERISLPTFQERPMRRKLDKPLCLCSDCRGLVVHRPGKARKSEVVSQQTFAEYLERQGLAHEMRDGRKRWFGMRAASRASRSKHEYAHEEISVLVWLGFCAHLKWCDEPHTHDELCSAAVGELYVSYNTFVGVQDAVSLKAFAQQLRRNRALRVVRRNRVLGLIARVSR